MPSEWWVAAGPVLVATWSIMCGYMLGLPRAERHPRALMLLLAAGVPLFLLMWALFIPESLRWTTMPLGSSQAGLVISLGVAVPAVLGMASGFLVERLQRKPSPMRSTVLSVLGGLWLILVVLSTIVLLLKGGLQIWETFGIRAALGTVRLLTC